MIRDDLTSALIELVHYSANEKARCGAISKLSLQFLGTGEERVASAIAEVVKDVAVSRPLRVFAYFCLLDVCVGCAGGRPSLDRFRFPEDVDWSLVERSGVSAEVRVSGISIASQRLRLDVDEIDQAIAWWSVRSDHVDSKLAEWMSNQVDLFVEQRSRVSKVIDLISESPKPCSMTSQQS